MKTRRREFIGNLGMGLSGVLIGDKLVGNKIPAVPGNNMNNLSMQEIVGNPRDVKLNVKLLYYAMIHSTLWEGPCRYSEMSLGPDREKEEARKNYEETVKAFGSGLGGDARMLEPAWFEFHENARIGRQDLIKLEEDKDEVDLYVLKGYNWGSHQELYFASLLAEFFGKPIVPAAHYGRTTSAYLNSIGMEGYPEYVYGGLNKLISLLRARKAFRQTRILLITDLGGSVSGPGFMRGSVRDFDDLKSLFGIGTVITGYKELSDERDRIMQDEKAMKDVEDLSGKMTGDARAVHMDKKMFGENILFYYTVKSLIKKHNCNAYSVECIEFCSSRLPQAWKITPCVSFSLLNGEGYPTSCEGEIGCLLAMNLFSSVSGKSAYMGNLNPFSDRTYDPKLYLWVTGAEKEKVNFSFGHNVPGLKMTGYDKPDLQYEIRNFIPDKPKIPGWGASLKIDFTKIEERTVTLGRFNPLTTKLLVTRAEIIGMRGFTLDRCSTEVLINIDDPESFHLRTANYGHHYVMVYGDYTKELIHMGDMLRFEVELHKV